MRKADMKIIEQRYQMVVKANEFVQKGRFRYLGLTEKKALAFLISKIKPDDKIKYTPEGERVAFEKDFEIKDFCRVCGITDAGKNYASIKAVLSNLRNKSWWLEKEDGGQVLMAWLSQAHITPKRGKVRVEIDPNALEFLVELAENEGRTQFPLIYITLMHSSHAVTFYELMKSWDGLGHKDYWVDELKKILGVEGVKSYSDFGVFRQKVINPALKEINGLTDLTVSMKVEERDANKITKVRFAIRHKTREEILGLQLAADKALDQKPGDLDQISIFEVVDDRERLLAKNPKLRSKIEKE